MVLFFYYKLYIKMQVCIISRKPWVIICFKYIFKGYKYLHLFQNLKKLTMIFFVSTN